ncbi:hypothetical protein A3F37_02560 [Candidatus Saccharibacteria bacterium RIFCSPHIGHO2_12_FULL_41_12]|nr:MAG: hypothetical protein A3F37_02560 [Candidatus Saccharibacteria bacterium RIFCSPHIGHO2_12_FULL_41_12]
MISFKNVGRKGPGGSGRSLDAENDILIVSQRNAQKPDDILPIFEATNEKVITFGTEVVINLSSTPSPEAIKIAGEVCDTFDPAQGTSPTAPDTTSKLKHSPL